MSESPEHDQGLKSIEARLAALVPRAGQVDDRAERDRLMFEAGRASVAPAGTTGRLGRWAWPASAATMTAAAASLLVLLLTRPGPQIAERIVVQHVEVSRDDSPDSRQPNDGVAKPNDPGGRATDLPAETTHTAPRPGLLASIGLGRLQLNSITGSLGIASHRRMLNDALTATIASPSPPTRSVGSNTGQIDAPISHRQLLHEMLDGPKADESSPRPPAIFTLFRRGADS